MGRVQKRAGALEEFKRNKIEAAVQRAGANERTARETAEAIENRFRERLQREANVPTHEIRMSVIEELRQRDAAAAKAFEEHKEHQH